MFVTITGSALGTGSPYFGFDFARMLIVTAAVVPEPTAWLAGGRGGFALTSALKGCGRVVTFSRHRREKAMRVGSIVLFAVVMMFQGLFPNRTTAQIFVTNPGHGTVEEFSTSGVLLDSTFISGLSDPAGIAIMGTEIFVANYGSNTIGEYNLDGDTVSASLITGLNGPIGLAVSGTTLFVTSESSGTIGAYNTTGFPSYRDIVGGLNAPIGITTVGSQLFVGENGSGTIDEFSSSGLLGIRDLITSAPPQNLGIPEGLTSAGNDIYVAAAGGRIQEYTSYGAVVNSSLVSGLLNPRGIFTDGSSILLTYDYEGYSTLGEFNTSGQTINANLLTDSSGNLLTYGIAAVGPIAVPEPASLGLLAIAGVSLLARRRRAINNALNRRAVNLFS